MEWLKSMYEQHQGEIIPMLQKIWEEHQKEIMEFLSNIWMKLTG